MVFKTTTQDKDHVLELLRNSYEKLQSLEQVNNQLIQDIEEDINTRLKELLDKGKISQELYNFQLAQNKVELQHRQDAKILLSNQINRLETIMNSDNPSECFVILSNTTKQELKDLIILINKNIDNTENEEEKLFLNAVLVTANGCKILLDEGRPFDIKFIPLKNNEGLYAFKLIAETNKLEPATMDYYLKKISELNLIQDAVNKDNNISTAEKDILAVLCHSLSKEFQNALTDAHSENVEKKIQKHLDKAIKQSEKIPITSGFKGFINTICKLCGIEEPIFKMDNSSLLRKIGEIKSQLHFFKYEDNNPVPDGPGPVMKKITV